MNPGDRIVLLVGKEAHGIPAGGYEAGSVHTVKRYLGDGVVGIHYGEWLTMYLTETMYRPEEVQ